MPTTRYKKPPIAVGHRVRFLYVPPRVEGIVGTRAANFPDPPDPSIRACDAECARIEIIGQTMILEKIESTVRDGIWRLVVRFPGKTPGGQKRLACEVVAHERAFVDAGLVP